ncbi:universal stress protein [Deltaproteobacteria bacterium TL4]
MEKRILVPIDYSGVSKKVLTFADEWCQRTGATLFILYVTVIRYTDYPEIWNKKEQRLEFHREELKAFVEALKLKSNVQLLNDVGVAYEQILRAEKEHHIDLIIMAAHSHTILERMFLGSNTDQILHQSQCPVFVFKDPDSKLKNKIILPIDNNEVDQYVIQKADEWALRTHSTLYFIHVYSPFANPFEPSIAEHPPQLLTLELDIKLNEFILSQNVKSPYRTIIKKGKPYDRILKLQKKQKANLIMMAAHSHTQIERFLMGSNTDYLAHHSSCPMYVFKTPKIKE